MDMIILRKEKFKQKSIYIRHGECEYCSGKYYDDIRELLSKDQKYLLTHGSEVYINEGVTHNYFDINEILVKIESDKSKIFSTKDLIKSKQRGGNLCV